MKTTKEEKVTPTILATAEEHGVELAVKDMTKKYAKETNEKIDETPEIVGKIMKYAFKKHILIEGEKGSGKTYSISKFLHDAGIETVFMAGHEGLWQAA
jgi:DNA-binding NtrC family response regulator